MQSLSSSLKLRLGLVACAWLAPLATAQAQTPPANACAGVEADLNSARSELSRARADLQTARTRAEGADAARSELERTSRELNEAQAEVNACHQSEQALCSATGAFARGLGEGRVSTSGVAACVDPGTQATLGDQLSGASSVAATLSQLGAFAAGETDVFPRPGRASTKLEKSLSRLFAAGNSSPLLYRRLLIEALEQVAPRSWATLRSKPGSVERWFGSREPLDEALVREVHADASSGPASAAEPAALSSALSLISAYELLAQCSSGTPARDCGRAHQLRQLLESNGPLITRRRIQDVWASECSSLNEAVVLEWLGNLPEARTTEAQTESVAQAVHSKLVTCFLRDSTAGRSYTAWLSDLLPKSEKLTTRTLGQLHKLEHAWQPGSPIDGCMRAVRSLQNLPAPSVCRAPEALLSEMSALAAGQASDDATGSFALGVCQRFAFTLWQGEAAAIPNSFPAPPTVEDAVRVAHDASPTSLNRLRSLCDDATGSGADFERSIRNLGRVGQALGENPALGPWNLDVPSLTPVVATRIERTRGTWPWFSHLRSPEGACQLLELGHARCQACREL
ncbi:MAG TPA: hypothetical protein VLC09_16340, partial [Polyangiaceae bacterium]|nr:hypothetical protein [Polyangiaceae bacterium]